jgi:hypothetical protein
MFSSMGNGFTFELESLLFYAITRVLAKASGIKGRISVYGDDIICPVRLVPRLKRMLAFLGFRLNSKKTHYKGFFRESCGIHIYKGLDVTPFYIRREVSTHSDLILHLNHFLEWSTRYGTGFNYEFFVDQSHMEFHRRWAQVVPSFLHGGYDVESNAALVTGTRPDRKIVACNKKLRFNQRVGSHLWLMSADFHEEREPFAVNPKRETHFVTRANYIPLGQRLTWFPYLVAE